MNELRPTINLEDIPVVIRGSENPSVNDDNQEVKVGSFSFFKDNFVIDFASENTLDIVLELLSEQYLNQDFFVVRDKDNNNYGLSIRPSKFVWCLTELSNNKKISSKMKSKVDSIKDSLISSSIT